MDLENYKLIEPVAIGAESVLYRAEDGDGNEFCVKAIRRFLKHHKGHVPVRERENPYPYNRKKKHLLNEYRVSQTLYAGPHDAIINIFHLREQKLFGWELGCDLLMEYLPGDDLGDRKFIRALPLREKIDILIQAAEAVHSLHNRGYVHLDIKPQNFMVTKGMVKIIDFGTTISRGTSPGRMVGTPGYLPPEQILGREAAHESNDVFSFGVAANEICGGRKLRQHPVASSKRQRKLDAVYSAQTNESPIEPATGGANHVPQELISLFQECTIPKKSNRYSNMDPVINQLRSIANRHNT